MLKKTIIAAAVGAVVGGAVGAAVAYTCMRKKVGNAENKVTYLINKNFKLEETIKEKDAIIANQGKENFAKNEEINKAKDELYETKIAYNKAMAEIKARAPWAAPEADEPYISDEDLPFETDEDEMPDDFDCTVYGCDEPYYISEEKFAYDTAYLKHEISVYADGVIADADGYCIEDDEIDALLGGRKMIDWDEACEDGSIYIRNENLCADYMIWKRSIPYGG